MVILIYCYSMGWDGLGHQLVEVSALTGKENYSISDEHCSAYRE
ncbi:hypothetical protein DF16_orf05265 [Bacillus thuringiensis serovar kurstaki str. YBT-1520]|nr:hypothetical protein DF16_orf05265 [Bacillus thuringiensis serovar kurstaki str. YBT-1520]